MNLRDKVENYIAFNKQEERDKEQFLQFIDVFNGDLTRDNVFGHFSASAFVVNKERTKMVIVDHIINGGWMYPGGHVDGETDFLAIAIREVKEETGLKANILDNNIFSIQSLPIKGHIKHGKYVSAHLHLDFVYLLEANDNIPLIYREDESKGVKWISFDEASNETMCDFIRPIHKKLIKKLNTR